MSVYALDRIDLFLIVFSGLASSDKWKKAWETRAWSDHGISAAGSTAYYFAILEFNKMIYEDNVKQRTILDDILTRQKQVLAAQEQYLKDNK